MDLDFVSKTVSCVAGDAGCARAGDDEVSTLLSALYSDTDAVRDAALRGLLALVNILPQLSNQLPLLTRRTWVLRCDSRYVSLMNHYYYGKPSKCKNFTGLSILTA